MRVFYKIIKVIAYQIIIMALLYSFFNSLTPIANDYAPQLITILSKHVDADIKVHSISTHWYGLHPVIVFNEVQVHPHNEAPLTFKKLMLGINFFKTLQSKQLESNLIVVEDLNLNIDSRNETARLKLQELEKLLLKQDRLILKNMSLKWHHGVQDIKLMGVTLEWRKFADYYALSFKAREYFTPWPNIVVLSKLKPSQNGFDGEVYIHTQNLSPTLLKQIPLQDLHILHAQGSIKSWLKIKDNQIHQVHALINLKKVESMLPEFTHSLKLDGLSATLFYESKQDGFKFYAQDINVQDKHQTSPPFDLSWTYDALTKYDELDISQISLKLLNQLPLKVDTLFQISKQVESAILSPLHLEFENNHFNRLYLDAKAINTHSNIGLPRFKGLKGSVKIDNDKGEFKLSGDSILATIGQGLWKLNTLNFKGYWTMKDNKPIFYIEDASLTHPYFSFSLNGLLQVSKQVNLSIQFKLNQWAPAIKEWFANYYPLTSSYIKKAQNINTQIYIQGAWQHPDLSLFLKGKRLELNTRAPFELTDINAKIIHQSNHSMLGQVLGVKNNKPFQIDLETAQNTHTLHFKLPFSIQELEKYYPSWGWAKLKGESLVDFNVTLNPNLTFKALSMRSDFEGIEVNAPKPFNKLSKETWPSLVVLNLKNNNLQFLGHIDTKLGLDLNFKRQPSYKFINGEITLGAPNATAKKTQGLHLAMTSETLNVDEWSAWLPKTKSTRQSSLPIDMTFMSSQAIWQQKLLGHLELKGRFQNHEFMLNTLRLGRPFYEMLVQNKRASLGQAERYTLDMHIDDVKKSTALFSFLKGVEAKKAYISGDFSLPKISDASLNQISGYFKYGFQDGRILEHKKSNGQWHLTRLFNLLNLERLPKRLLLDFSDVLEKGYPFTTWVGHLELKQGVLTTQDSEIDSTIFTALMKGKLDLNALAYHINIGVTPNVLEGMSLKQRDDILEASVGKAQRGIEVYHFSMQGSLKTEDKSIASSTMTRNF